MPTIKALAYARKRASSMNRFNPDKPELLSVTMPTTPGQKPYSGSSARSLGDPEHS
jgi:hypothetical protein